MTRMVIFFTFLFASQSLYSQFVPPRQGSIENSRGEQCEFITNITTQSYFTNRPQRIFIHTFQNYHYMLNQDKSKSIIAETVVTWLKRSSAQRRDLNFQTQFKRWIPHGDFQAYLKRGYAIPAENDQQVLFIDFEYNDNRQYIVRFMYAVYPG